MGKPTEPVILLALACKGCDFAALAKTGKLNNFDAAIRAASTHVRMTGHEVAVQGGIGPESEVIRDNNKTVAPAST